MDGERREELQQIISRMRCADISGRGGKPVIPLIDAFFTDVYASSRFQFVTMQAKNFKTCYKLFFSRFHSVVEGYSNCIFSISASDKTKVSADDIVLFFNKFDEFPDPISYVWGLSLIPHGMSGVVIDLLVYD